MWQWLLEKTMNYAIGKDVFGKVMALVEATANNTTLTGQQKREKVLAEVKDLGKDFASHLLNLSIEAAVTLLKAKTAGK